MRKVAALGMVICVVVGRLYALDPTDRGFRVLAQRTEAGVTYYDLQAAEGPNVTVGVVGAFSSQQLDSIEAIHAEFAAFDVAEFASVRIVFTRSRAEIQAVPSRYQAEGVNVLQYMPSGMLFFYTTFLEYDFSLVVDNLRLRIFGQFFSPEQLTDTMVRAIRNPGAFLQSQDPEFVIRRFAEVDRVIQSLQNENRLRTQENAALRAALAAAEERLAAVDELLATADERLAVTDERLAAADEQLSGELAATQADLVQTQANLERTRTTLQTELRTAIATTTSWFDQAIADAHRALRQTDARLTQRLDEQRRDHEALGDDHQRFAAATDATFDRVWRSGEQAVADTLAAMLAGDAALDAALTAALNAVQAELTAAMQRAQEQADARYAEFTALRFALMVLENRGIFDIVRLPNATVVQQLLVWKQETPDLTFKDAWDRARTEKLDVSRHVVWLVWGLYFNEFDQ